MSTNKSKETPFNKLKNFFSKKKLDSKFKNAGEGHRLADVTRQPIIISEQKQFCATPRQELSESAQKAAEAALIREYEKTAVKPKSKLTYDTSGFKKEIESEKNELMKAYEIRDRALGKTVELEKPSQLGELKYCCPVLFEYDVIGTYTDLKENILIYLKSELEENPLEASCLIIYSRCNNADVLTNCLNILETLINNLIKSPNEAKFKKIRLTNDKIRQNIVDVEGAIAFLKAIGFHEEELPKSELSDEMETFLVISDDACIPERLAECLEKLKQAEPIKPILYRDTKVYHRSNLVNIVENELPPEFFRISLEEIKKQNELRRQQIEESGMLMTKQMRENMKIRDRRKYRYVLIRVLFPNDWVLQGTFEAINQVGDIKNWICDCLKVNDPFSLSVPPITKKIDDLDQRIVDANLAPCATLRVVFEDGSRNQCQDKYANHFLKESLLT